MKEPHKKKKKHSHFFILTKTTIKHKIDKNESEFKWSNVINKTKINSWLIRSNQKKNRKTNAYNKPNSKNHFLNKNIEKQNKNTITNI